jgi:hypothetical protein
MKIKTLVTKTKRWERDHLPMLSIVITAIPIYLFLLHTKKMNDA